MRFSGSIQLSLLEIDQIIRDYLRYQGVHPKEYVGHLESVSGTDEDNNDNVTFPKDDSIFLIKFYRIS